MGWGSLTFADLIPHPSLKMIGFDYADLDRPLLWGSGLCGLVSEPEGHAGALPGPGAVQGSADPVL